MKRDMFEPDAVEVGVIECCGPPECCAVELRFGEERGTLEDVIEPYLIQEGFIMRTPRGRVAMHNAYRHFGLPIPETPPTIAAE